MELKHALASERSLFAKTKNKLDQALEHEWKVSQAISFLEEELAIELKLTGELWVQLE